MAWHPANTETKQRKQELRGLAGMDSSIAEGRLDEAAAAKIRFNDAGDAGVPTLWVFSIQKSPAT